MSSAATTPHSLSEWRPQRSATTSPSPRCPEQPVGKENPCQERARPFHIAPQIPVKYPKRLEAARVFPLKAPQQCPYPKIDLISIQDLYLDKTIQNQEDRLNAVVKRTIEIAMNALASDIQKEAYRYTNLPDLQQRIEEINSYFPASPKTAKKLDTKASQVKGSDMLFNCLKQSKKDPKLILPHLKLQIQYHESALKKCTAPKDKALRCRLETAQNLLKDTLKTLSQHVAPPHSRGDNKFCRQPTPRMGMDKKKSSKP